ncbi:MAG: hypothetical protein ACMZ66_05390 [Thalassospira sp.]|uniref:hypothetical protein n=1 Tax=Thalassospira sp. TaxID=1912094 RepID=UPI003A8732E1
MIRKIAATAFFLLLGACQTTQAPANKDYSATVADAAKTVCIPYVGDTTALRKAAMAYTGDSGKEFDLKDVTGPIKVWHYQIVEDGRNVSFIAVGGPGSCGVTFVNDVADLDVVQGDLGAEVYGGFRPSALKNQTGYGRIEGQNFVVLFSAFDFDQGKASHGVSFITQDAYQRVEVPNGAPEKLEWGG